MHKINYGVALPYVSARTIAELAQLAEEAGWDGCFVGDAIWCEDPMIGLAAAATQTSRIRLGTMITPVPLRRPWKLASESVALDHLCGGRLTLGLATGAPWMGWQAFPDEATAVATRSGMLAETIDILTLLYQRRPFDYDGQHYQVKLTLLDEMYYPPQPVQQTRIPLWCVGLWPREQSLQRALKCDGVIVEKVNVSDDAPLTPDDIRQVVAYIKQNRPATAPFDIVVNGKTIGFTPQQQQETLARWVSAGISWWIEGLWDEAEVVARQRIVQGPPTID